MHTDDFDFALPPELIAQEPLPARDASRLLHVNRGTAARAHRQFRELPQLLRAGDLLVLNDTRVIPARLLGQKATTGGRAELLLVRPAAPATTAEALAQPAGSLEWDCLGQASKGLKPGTALEFAAGLTATVVAALGGGLVRVRFSHAGSLDAALSQAGQLPLPPYISRAPSAADAERYQTVYARHSGSVAAPTAGLHFTPALFEALEARGVHRAHVTLEVGPGTFMPVREGDVSAHVMHKERCRISAETAAAIAAARARGGRVIAVGTTVVRTLESLADGQGGVRAEDADTGIFITPGFRFQVIDALITNFHLPRSTLVMLVSALLGREQTLAAYADAVETRYRFFSYGDAMFIDPGAP
jgi:S-adenosylmethionine:tRNA ribosyltransferase-isomerase